MKANVLKRIMMKKSVMMCITLALVCVFAAARPSTSGEFGVGGLDEVPYELQGTWVRFNAVSKRGFDIWMTITEDTVQWVYSDGRPDEFASILAVHPMINNSAAFDGDNKAMNKAKEFPSGWYLTVREDEEFQGYGFFLNAGKDKLTQASNNDLKDIWEKE